MINLLGKVPNKIAIAVSGGPDSMAMLSFLMNSNRNLVVAHFNHGTAHGEAAEIFITEFCLKNDISFVCGQIQRTRSPDESPEEYWRNERYDFFKRSLPKGLPVITCHHLDDVIENYIFTAFHGAPKLIPYKRDEFIRPLLLTRKSQLIDYCDNKGVNYVTDPSNSENVHMRSYIRWNIVPRALRVNPGLHKTVKKLILESYEINNTIDELMLHN